MRGGGWYHNSVKTTIFNNSVNSHDDMVKATSNSYLCSLADNSLLQILQKNRVKAAFENEDRERSLFHLFLGCSLFDGILVWTNAKLAKRGKEAINKDKLLMLALRLPCQLFRSAA
jgi:hypothetical protein